MSDDRKTLTTSSGNPIDNNQNSMTAGPRGPVLLQDFTLIDKLASFDRERIPERVVHAKGSAAHGFFEVSNDVTGLTRAAFLNQIGKRTPCFLRFSTVAGERGSPDTVRDPRGFAIKFYTEEGNYDMVGNNTPVFFINDPIKFPDFLHSQKRHPATNVQDVNSIFDFWQHSPEALHQVTILFSDRGTPYGYRHMNGYSSHTFKWVNAKGEVHFVKYHFKTDQGIKNFTNEENDAMLGKNREFSQTDLYDNIEAGNFPSWTWYVQVMPEADAENYRFDILDITKVWPQSDYPLQKVGKMTLNRNPENYHAEVEQAAFAPSHLVPGIEPSNDKMLQGRLFSYPDTHRHRLGANYKQMPINCPYRARVSNYQRDNRVYNGNQGSEVNHEPNSQGGPVQDSQYAWTSDKINAQTGRYAPVHPNTYFEQPRTLYNKVFNEEQKATLIRNLSGALGGVKRRDIKENMLALFYKIDPDYGTRLSKAIGVPLNRAKL
jgi:catalase